MMKTDNLTDAIRNSEHVKNDKNIFEMNSMKEHKHGLGV